MDQYLNRVNRRNDIDMFFETKKAERTVELGKTEESAAAIEEKIKEEFPRPTLLQLDPKQEAQALATIKMEIGLVHSEIDRMNHRLSENKIFQQSDVLKNAFAEFSAAFYDFEELIFPSTETSTTARGQAISYQLDLLRNQFLARMIDTMNENLKNE